MARGHLGIEALGKASRKAALIGLLGIVVIISSLIYSASSLVHSEEKLESSEEKLELAEDAQRELRGKCKTALGQLKTGDVVGAMRTLDEEPSPDDVKPRVYIHVVPPPPEWDWRGAEQVAKIKPIADLLRQKGFSVPRADMLVTTDPDRSEVRYFRKDDEEEATGILNVLVSQGIRSCRLNYLKGPEESEFVRPRHYEVWLVGPPSPPPDFAAARIEFEIISWTESQRQVCITGVIRNVGRAAFESGRGQQQAQLWEYPCPEPPPPAAEDSNIANLEPWSEQTNFMSLTGSLRCMIFQEWGFWLSVAEAKRLVAELLAQLPPAPRPAPRLVASTDFERLAPNEEITVVYKRPWDAVSADPGEAETPPTYRLVIWYDPSIALDANPKNDDTNAGNNMTKRSGTRIGIGSPRS